MPMIIAITLINSIIFLTTIIIRIQADRIEYGTEVLQIRRSDEGFDLDLLRDGATTTRRCKRVVV